MAKSTAKSHTRTDTYHFLLAKPKMLTVNCGWRCQHVNTYMRESLLFFRTKNSGF